MAGTETGANSLALESEVNMINSPEELALALKGTGNAVKESETEDEIEEVEKPTSKKKVAPAKAKVGDGIPEEIPSEEDEEEEEETEDEEFPSVAHYLNEKYQMGLNMADVPKELTRAQEAELTGRIFERVQNGAKNAVKNALVQYKHIDNIMKDPEVAAFIKAKSEGKTLKDYVSQYAGTSAGSPDDVLVEKHFKLQFPDMNEAEIKAMIEENREKGRLPKLAESARKFYKVSEENTAKQQAAQEAADAEAEEVEYRQSVGRIGQLLKNTEKVYGVTLNPEMKNQLFSAITVRDEEGLTQHDRALQSDAGVLRSALGLFLIDKIVRDASSLKANKSKKQFMDTVFDDASKLQSRSEAKSQPEFSAEIANSW